jgi:UDP-N-acetylglucosamine--N-acetylmuramyl-(pentapeptide) pyrophosphoryl-undecaprenol N-acetylglucosamine transferase
MTPSTVLFQSPNRIGLGHLSRLLAIALELKRADPSVRTPFIVEGDGHGLIAAHGMPEFNLPSSFDLIESGRWNDWEGPDRHALVQDVAWALLRRFAPRLVVFDCFPNVTVAHAAFEMGIPAAVCLRKAKAINSYFDRLRQLTSQVQLVIVPHTEEEFPVPDDIRPRTRFTGPIVRPAPDGEVPFERRPGSRLAVISGGGGGFPSVADFYNLAIAAFARARAARPDLEAVLIAGPLFKDWWSLDLTDGMRVIPFEPRLSRLFAAADVVICQAGYNTVAEITSLGVPAIVVPAERKADDQLARAQSHASHVFQVYDGTNPDAVAALLLRTIDSPVRPVRRELPTDGAAIAASCLLELMASQSLSAHTPPAVTAPPVTPVPLPAS